MRLLKSEPAGALNSLEELLALAHVMENEAVARYSEYAVAMRAQNEPELAALFEAIADEERGHLASVDNWSENRSGRAPDHKTLRWLPPPTFDEEDAAELAGSRLLTPYRVLTIATQNEERAFTFWSYVAAHANTEDVRAAAETMAKEELGHVAAFRRERRRAYHAERQSGRPARERISAALLEGRLASGLEAIKTEHTVDLVRINELIWETRDIARSLEELHGLTAAAQPDASVESLAELLAEAYLAAADATQSDDQLARLQSVAPRAIARLALIRSIVAA